ncbi:hypothetical protein DPEC_G00155080 [Dallia pectoralis]|uniref:Uncharacterized protein n=1 Tax=Dallia pectoralis TaxID=75939 RepID=A0ACC2GK97_DALPE|nr:hypothetical protein DPEC_G00155080 [Dallia pectoralis]
MNIGCWCFIYMFLLMECRVFSQERIEGFQGENVTLPCTYNETKMQVVTFFWRYNADTSVYDVIAGTIKLNSQYLQFKNRTWTVPKEWENGNFSLQLTNLTASDSGTYSCALPRAETNCVVKLSVRVRPTPKPKVDPGSSSVSFSGNKVCLFLFLFITTLFL